MPVKSNGLKSTESRMFANGETVKILRPNMHFGCVGEVVGFRDGFHIVRIPTKPDMAVEKFWSAAAKGSELESFI